MCVCWKKITMVHNPSDSIGCLSFCLHLPLFLSLSSLSQSAFDFLFSLLCLFPSLSFTLTLKLSFSLSLCLILSLSFFLSLVLKLIQACAQWSVCIRYHACEHMCMPLFMYMCTAICIHSACTIHVYMNMRGLHLSHHVCEHICKSERRICNISAQA